jgi:hypothetical protein
LDGADNEHTIAPHTGAWRRREMLKYEFLNKEWIVSPTARRVYRVSATLSVALFFAVFVILANGGMPGASPSVARALLFAGALGIGNYPHRNGVFHVSLRRLAPIQADSLVLRNALPLTPSRSLLLRRLLTLTSG